jgi:tetratricopeptide (TPR) repeat protein
MKIIIFIIKVFAISLIISQISHAQKNNYYEKGIAFFNKKEFDKSKLFFEKDIVFNPKNEKSYLYLAKISKKSELDDTQEINLNNVLIIDPKNDEAIYLLTLLKIKQFDYNGAKELIDKFDLFCNLFCSKKDEIKNKLKKISPKNAQN